MGKLRVFYYITSYHRLINPDQCTSTLILSLWLVNRPRFDTPPA
jgi:hypothetical protein